MDRDKIFFGCLFHDIGKSYSKIAGEYEKIPHNEVGFEILKKEGLDDFALIAREHFTYNFVDGEFSFIESKVINFADKFISKENFYFMEDYFDALIKEADFHIKEKPIYMEFFNSFLNHKDEIKIQNILNEITFSSDWEKEMNFVREKYYG